MVLLLIVLLFSGCGGLGGCGGRAIPSEAPIPGPTEGKADAGGGEADAAGRPAHVSGGAGDRCVVGVVRLGSTVACDPGDPRRDCRGTLCVELFALTGPMAPIVRACAEGVDLGSGFATYELAYRRAGLDAYPLVVGAFLAETRSAADSTGPLKGDPWHVPPKSGVQPVAGCWQADLALARRFPQI